MQNHTAYSLPPEFVQFTKRVFSPPLFLPSSVFAAGIWLGSVFEIRFALIWLSTLIACFGILVSLRRLSGIGWVLLAFFLAGILRISASHLYTPQHVCFLANGKGVLQGHVSSLPEIVSKGKRRMTRFLLSAQSWRINRTLYPATGDVQVFAFYAPDQIRFGDQIRIWGELMLPKRATNPEEFDYARYLERQGIYRVFQSFGKKSIWFLDTVDLSWRSKIENLRLSIQQRINLLFPFPNREIIQALWIGFRRNIPDEINNVFTRTGTVHLLSISGLHVTLVGGFFYFLSRQLSVPRKLNAVFSTMVILFYALIAGGMPPVVRSGFMGTLIFGGILLEQDTDSWNILVTAFLLFLIWNPSALFLLSFQLSFLSMTVLVLFSGVNQDKTNQPGFHPMGISKRKKIGAWFRDNIRTSFLIIALLLPVFASYFHLSSLSGALANLAAIPMSLWIMVVSLTAFTASFVSWTLASWLVWLTSGLFSIMLSFLSLLSKLSFLNWHLPSPSLLVCVVYYSTLAIFYWHPPFKRFRNLALTVTVFLFLISLSLTVPPGMTFFDTGQSDSILLRFSKNKALFINSGRRLSESRLDWVIEPSLLSTSVRKLWVLLGDSKQNLKRQEIKNLAQGFTLKNFDSKLFPEVELFWLQNGKLGACLTKLAKQKALILFQPEESLINRLRNWHIKDLDVLYVAIRGKGNMERYLPEFLSQIRMKHVIINDRKFSSDFLNQINGLGRSVLHFLSEGGSVSL